MKAQLPIFNYKVGIRTGNTLEIAIDGQIVDAETEQIFRDWFGDDTTMSFRTFRDSINEAVANGVTVINGTINSPGGMITEAMAMHDFIVELQGKGITVNMQGLGLVASAATYPLMASKNSSLGANCLFMIHNVSGWAYGDVEEVERQARTLRTFNDKVRDFYCEATGLSKTVIGNMMSAETWMTADEAKAKGFVAGVGSSTPITNALDPEKWLFKNRAILNTYNASIQKQPEMDYKAISDAISTGFNSMLEKMGWNKGKEGASDALDEFSTSIVNAIKEAAPSDDSIKEMVNNAVAAAMKTVPENFQAAITAAVADAAKNTATKEELQKVDDELEAVKKDIANRSGAVRTTGNGGRKAGNTARETDEGIAFE